MDRIGDIKVLFKQGVSSVGHPRYPGFNPETKIMRKGSILKDGALALPCDIVLWERDVEIVLRDDTKIYLDIFRPPVSGARVPAIISSGGFGKDGGVNRLITDQSPWRNGIPQATVSSLY
ncbi:hypothetical protein CBS147343_844 [Aspergillus niger]|uniref:Uncharacterized protein n=2 Tax=Aspergillus TaxID=5052 RepID=A0A370P4M8_ASPPH|nr:hypothetical protein CBS133816_3763 [Aspergillus niger]RDK36826.1 hypothetical protein M752DRAFT_298902 [Aspergillus phoenicis ATCC 13157]KAI2850909.1 hypothetical protein CBS11350_1501 [Aspergillus niger]KAI2867793.1 hypothetical protein CBS12448_239 [Aspergillus niger]KAI2897295.1 hypothetical protein CBS13152_3038 [Aspergillus niger]